MLYRFHANIFARPAHAVDGDVAVTLRGIELSARRRQTFDAYLSVTFEQAYEALMQVPRLDAEPDGFFVVAGDADGCRWQLDGHLFDFGNRLHRVELHGECPPEALDAILACLGWPETPLIFELVMEGVALEEQMFRRFAPCMA